MQMSTKENNRGMFGFYTTEKKKDGSVISHRIHLYPTAQQANRARAAYIAHVCCRSRVKSNTLTYEIYDFKKNKIVTKTVPVPNYMVGPVTLF